MRILTFDELTPAMDLDRALIQLSAFDGVFTARAIDLLRRRTKVLADYAGVFAVEGRRVLGQVFVHRLPYAFREGPTVISGIAGVATRPDKGRSGVARTLLSEVHRLERENGREYAALWTNRSWGAHGLYEELGYRDVYSPPSVVHLPRSPRGRGSRTPGIGPGKSSDLDGIDRLHDRIGETRLGFYRRPKGFSRLEVRLGSLDPGKNLLVARRSHEVVGYAHFDRNPWRLVCGELVTESPAVRRALVREVGRAATGRHIVLHQTTVSDAREIFEGRGYASVPVGWYGIMGAKLGRAWATDEAIHQFATDDPRFLCLDGDRF